MANSYVPRAINLIEYERQRQVASEGYTAAHDRTHSQGELAEAAAAYILRKPNLWPFEPASFKPKDRYDDLIRAGALIVAELDRLIAELHDATKVTR